MPPVSSGSSRRYRDRHGDRYVFSGASLRARQPDVYPGGRADGRLLKNCATCRRRLIIHRTIEIIIFQPCDNVGRDAGAFVLPIKWKKLEGD